MVWNEMFHHKFVGLSPTCRITKIKYGFSVILLQNCQIRLGTVNPNLGDFEIVHDHFLSRRIIIPLCAEKLYMPTQHIFGGNFPYLCVFDEQQYENSPMPKSHLFQLSGELGMDVRFRLLADIPVIQRN